MQGNLFKTRFLPTIDGTESSTALTDANTVCVHTYIGNDNTGDGTRSKPYRSMSKALLKSGMTYVLFRGVINEYFDSRYRIIIGDDNNQNIIYSDYPSLILGAVTKVTLDKYCVSVDAVSGAFISNLIIQSTSNLDVSYGKQNQFLLYKNGANLMESLSPISVLNYTVNGIISSITGRDYPTFFTNSLFSNVINITSAYIAHLKSRSLYLFTYCVFASSTTFRYNGTSLNVSFGNNSFTNIDLVIAAYILAGVSSSDITYVFKKDAFGNNTCKIIKEQRNGGISPNIFNKYDMNGAVADFTLNPDVSNEALWASNIGGYVGCFKPSVDGMLDSPDSIWNVNSDGSQSTTAGSLVYVNEFDELVFNSSPAQTWNRITDDEVIEIEAGSKFVGLNCMSQDGSPYGHYIGKKQDLIDLTIVNAGDILEVGCGYKIFNDFSNDPTKSILYNNIIYSPEYTFYCVSGVTTFSLLNQDSGTYCKKVNGVPFQSVEIFPYDNASTPSSFPKFSAPLMGECKLIYYTSAGATRYSKTAGDPVLFHHLSEANFQADFPNVNKKIAWYDGYAISNADQEFYSLCNAGLGSPKSTYFTTAIPTLKFLKREINAHFDAPYDY